MCAQLGVLGVANIHNYDTVISRKSIEHGQTRIETAISAELRRTFPILLYVKVNNITDVTAVSFAICTDYYSKPRGFTSDDAPLCIYEQYPSYEIKGYCWGIWYVGRAFADGLALTAEVRSVSSTYIRSSSCSSFNGNRISAKLDRIT